MQGLATHSLYCSLYENSCSALLCIVDFVVFINILMNYWCPLVKWQFYSFKLSTVLSPLRVFLSGVTFVVYISGCNLFCIFIFKQKFKYIFPHTCIIIV